MRKLVFAAIFLALAVVLTGCLPGMMIGGGRDVPDHLWYRVEVPPKNDYLIIPGERIGLLYIGMTLGDVKKLLGEPDSMYDSTKYGGIGYSYGWSAFSVTVVSADDSGRVFSIVLLLLRESPEPVALQKYAERYRTPNGLGIGSTLASVSAVYGAARPGFRGSAMIHADVGDRGMLFAFQGPGADERVRALSIGNRAVSLHLIRQRDAERR